MSVGRLDMNWHERVFTTAHIAVPQAISSECADYDDIAGDYLPLVVERSPQGCRWELAIPVRCELNQIVLLVKPNLQWNGFCFQVFFEGLVAGPRWHQECASHIEASLLLSLNAEQTDRPVAGCIWPAGITVTLLPVTLPGRGHSIFPM